MKKFLCWIGWHASRKFYWFCDGASIHAQCSRCGYTKELNQWILALEAQRDRLESERDKLLQTLAKERDEFGKKETELKSRSQEWRELSTQKSELLDKIFADRDVWEEIAERLASLMQWIHEEYERGERKGYEFKVTPEMNGQMIEVLAALKDKSK